MTAAARASWPDAFEAIRRDFGYDAAEDRRVAAWLADRLRRPSYDCAAALARCRTRTQGQAVYVLGAADRAPQDLVKVPPGATLWCADGATTPAVEAHRVPDAIVTDLDGGVADEVEAARAGAVAFLHAHGDNEDALHRELPRFPAAAVAGTCQVEPAAPLINPGGFTDGDRAVHLALLLGAAEVRLVGFDFERPGCYSGRLDPETKRRKLAWARRLIEGLAASGAPVRFA